VVKDTSWRFLFRRPAWARLEPPRTHPNLQQAAARS
jgi:hypothetical protein